MLSTQTCTLLICFMFLVWFLKNLPYINPGAAWNLQMQISEWLRKLDEIISEAEKDIKEEENDKHHPWG